MKAKKLLFNGVIFDIDDSLKANIQKSFDECIPGAIIVNDITIMDKEISVKIERRCNRFYEASEGLITLDDAAIFSGVLNKGSNKKIPLGLHPYADIYNYMLHPEDIVNHYNEIMKRNNKLIELKVESNEMGVTYKLTFKD